jgi:hypothetical protein
MSRWVEDAALLPGAEAACGWSAAASCVKDAARVASVLLLCASSRPLGCLEAAADGSAGGTGPDAALLAVWLPLEYTVRLLELGCLEAAADGTAAAVAVTRRLPLLLPGLLLLPPLLWRLLAPAAAAAAAAVAAAITAGMEASMSSTVEISKLSCCCCCCAAAAAALARCISALATASAMTA